MTEESHDLSFRGIRVHFRSFAPEDAPVERVMLLSSPFISSFHWRKVRPIPEDDDFFENVWRAYRETGNID